MTRSTILAKIRAIDDRVYRPPLSPSESAELIRRRRELLQRLHSAHVTQSPRTAARPYEGSRSNYNTHKVQR